jgi:hypothetical protein
LRHNLADIIYFKGLTLQRRGNLDDAIACLQDARSEAEHSGSRWMQWRILAALSETEATRGNPVQARSLQAESRKNLEYIISYTPPALRETFLNKSDVRQMMAV